MAKGIMSLEAFGLDADPLIIETIESPEELFSEQEEAGIEIDALDADIDEASMTADTLEKMHGSLESSLDAGGLNEDEVRALEVAVEHLLTQVGFPKTRKPFPALEGFKEKGYERIASTRISMENIKEGFQTLWKTIVEALRKLWSQISTFFQHLFNASLKVKKQAAALKKKAVESKIPPGDRVIQFGNFGKVLFTATNIPKGPALVTAYENLIKDPVVGMDRTDVISKVGALIKEQLVETEKDKRIENAGKLEDLLLEATLNHAGEVVASTGDKTVVQRYTLPFGHMSFWTTQEKETYKLSVELKPTDTTEQKYPDTLSALEISEVIKLADIVYNHMDLYKVVISHLDQAIAKMGALVDSVKIIASDENAKASNKIFHNLTNVILQSAKVLRKYDISVAKAILDYGFASLAAPTA